MTHATTTLGSFVRARSAEMIADWERGAAQLAVARNLPGPALSDHVPDLLDAIARAADDGDASRPLNDATEDANVRLRAGLECSAVISELSLLRDCVLHAWSREAGAQGADASILLYRALDAVVMRSVGAYMRARDRTQRAVDRVTTAALEAATLEELLPQLLAAFTATSPRVDLAAILLVEDGMLRARAATGLELRTLADYVQPIDTGFVGRIAAVRAPVYLPNAKGHPMVAPSPLLARAPTALFGVPLLFRRDLVGVAYVGSTVATELSYDDRELFTALASRASVGIAELVLRARVERTTAKINALLAAAPAGIAFVDRDLRYLQINDALAQLNGVSVADHLGRRVSEVLPKEMAGPLAEILTGVMESGRPLLNAQYRAATPSTPDTLRALVVSFFPVHVGDDVVGVGVIVNDVSDLHDSKERAARRAAELEAVIESCPAAVFIGDRLRVEQCNAAALSLLGYPSARELGGVSDVIAQSLPRDVESGEALGVDDMPLTRALAGARVERQMILRNRTTGEDIVVSAIAAPVRLEGRVVSSAVSVHVDITDQRRLLEAAHHETRLREEVLAIVSHDLRNPLATVMLAAEALKGSVAERGLRSLDRIFRSTAQMQRMIGDLLDMASIQAGRLRVELRPRLLLEVVREAAAQWAAQAEHAQVILARAFGELEGVLVALDYDRLMQVLGNLLGNAVKFSPPGGVVTLAGEVRDDVVVVSVNDQGPGIPDDERAVIFEAFRSGSAHARRGTGLGLFIARGIVEAHGGRISVNTAPGAGSTFFVMLPRLTERASLAVGASEHEHVAAASSDPRMHVRTELRWP